MNDELVLFGTAKLAKEKGFNYPTMDFYPEWIDAITKDKQVFNCTEVGYPTHTDDMRGEHGFGDITKVPTQSLLQRWLREKHDIIVWVIPAYKEDNIHLFRAFVANEMPSEEGQIKYSSDSLSYEEALEVGLQEGLRLI